MGCGCDGPGGLSGPDYAMLEQLFAEHYGCQASAQNRPVLRAVLRCTLQHLGELISGDNWEETLAKIAACVADSGVLVRSSPSWVFCLAAAIDEYRTSGSVVRAILKLAACLSSDPDQPEPPVEPPVEPSVYRPGSRRRC